MDKSLFPGSVRDIYGRKYMLREENSHSGGQGIMFQYDNYAVKLLFAKGDQLHSVSTDEKAYKRYQSSLIRLMSMPDLPHLSLPIAGLESPYCGYVMRFMDGLQPLSTLLEKPRKGETRSHTYPYPNGSLKKRLTILKNLSDVLRNVHNAGLVYCDLTPNNIFVSIDDDQAETWLIDVDNLCYAGESNDTWQTPWYRSPELYSGLSKNTIESDCYSFAVIAFQLLTLSRPFEGTMYSQIEDNAGWDDEDTWEDVPTAQETAGQKAVESGDLSYIGEPNTKNRQQYGIPLQYVSTKLIQEMMLKTLGPIGRKKPLERPTMNEWYQALDDACNQLVYCGKGHYHFGSECFLCNNNDNQNRYCRVVIQRIIRADSENKLVRSKDKHIQVGERWMLMNRNSEATSHRRSTGTTTVAIPWKWFPRSALQHDGESPAFFIEISKDKITVIDDYDHDLRVRITKEMLPATIVAEYSSCFEFELVIEEV